MEIASVSISEVNDEIPDSSAMEYKYTGINEVETESSDKNEIELSSSPPDSPQTEKEKYSNELKWLDSVKESIEHSIGPINEAPHYLQDNEYLINGYRINFFTRKKIIKSLFMCHNETFNIWSHLISAIFCVYLIYNTENYFNNAIAVLNKEQVWHASKINGTNIFQTRLPYLYNERLINSEIISEVESSEGFNSKLYLKMMGIVNKRVDLSFVRSNHQITGEFEKIQEFLKNLVTITNQLKDFNELIDKYVSKENTSSEYANLVKKVTSKLEYYQSSVEYISNESSKYLKQYGLISDSGSPSDLIGDYHRYPKQFRLIIWPIYVFLCLAILCFINSAIFHLFSALGEKAMAFLSRLDYAGIASLITGSCIPPYYYLYYCSTKYRLFFVGFISTCSIGVFLFTLIPQFNRPVWRKVRGILFLTLGLSAASPLIHLFLFFNPNIGMIDDPILIFWIGGGLFYIVGVLIYLSRQPEKACRGRFDYCGASHQIWHVFTILGMLTHYMGCVGCYYDRILHECPRI